MFKKVLFLSVIVLAVSVVASVAMAADETAAPVTEATPMIEAPVADAPVVVNVGNTICPVTDAAVANPSEFTVEHEGKIYNLCCSLCKDKFLADPTTFVAKVDAELAKVKEAAPAEDVVVAIPVETK